METESISIFIWYTYFTYFINTVLFDKTLKVAFFA